MNKLLDDLIYEIRRWLTKEHIKYVAIAAVAAIVGLTLLNNYVLKPKRGIDLSRIISVEYSGFDTYGEAKLTVNENALKEALKTYPQANGHTYKFELDKTKDLKNGDEILVRIFEDGKEITSKEILGKIEANQEYTLAQNEINEEMVVEIKGADDQSVEDMTQLGAGVPEATVSATPTAEAEEDISVQKTQSRSENVRFKDKSFKIKGLSECKIYTKEEVFAGLKLEFTGASPRLAVRMENATKDPNLSFVSFEVDKKDHIANGDLLVITPKWSEDTGKRIGFRIPEMQLRYTVGEHSKYIKSSSALTQDQMRSLLLSAASSASSALKKGLTLNDKKVKFNEIWGLKVKKVYFIRTGSEDSQVLSDTYNGMYMVFSFSGKEVVKTNARTEKTTTYDNCYAGVMLTNLILNTDGTINKSAVAVNESSLVSNSLNIQTETLYPSSADLYDGELKQFEGNYIIDQMPLVIQDEVAKIIEQQTSAESQEVDIPEDNAVEEAPQEEETAEEGQQNAQEEDIIFSVNDGESP